MGVTPPLLRCGVETGGSHGALDSVELCEETVLCEAILEASSVTTTLEAPREERSGLDDDEPLVESAASKSKPPMLDSSFFLDLFSFLGCGAARLGSGSFRLGALRAVSALAMFSWPSRTLACEAAAPLTRAEDTT